MNNASDTRLADILVSPCTPCVYTLGPNPVHQGYLVTRETEKYLSLEQYSNIFIVSGGEKWMITTANGDRLDIETLKFKCPENNDDSMFDSMVEAKEFWYNVYIKTLFRTCQDKDSGILGVWSVKVDATGTTQLEKLNW